MDLADTVVTRTDAAPSGRTYHRDGVQTGNRQLHECEQWLSNSERHDHLKSCEAQIVGPHPRVSDSGHVHQNADFENSCITRVIGVRR